MGGRILGGSQDERRSHAVTPDERRNERLKLTANWANTIATAIMAAGTFVPAANFIYGILPQNTDLAVVYGSGVICIGAGILIHLWGQWIMGGLE
jgi:hypothetical protein